MTFDTTAVVLIGTLIYAFVDFSKDVTNALAKTATWNAPLTHLYAAASGVAAVFLVGTTSWAQFPVMGNTPLDKLNTGSKIVAGVLASGAAQSGFQIVGSATKKLLPKSGGPTT